MYLHCMRCTTDCHIHIRNVTATCNVSALHAFNVQRPVLLNAAVSAVLLKADVLTSLR